MECTCSLGYCQPHRLLTGPPQPRQALTAEHIEIIRRQDESDWPDDKTHLSRKETALWFDAEEILEAQRTGNWLAR